MSNIRKDFIKPKSVAQSLTNANLQKALVAAHRKAIREAPSTARSYSVFYRFVGGDGRPVMQQTAHVRVRIHYYAGEREGMSRLPRVNIAPKRLMFGQAAATLAIVLFVLFMLAGAALAQQGRSSSAKRRVTSSNVGREVDRTLNEVERWKARVRRIGQNTPAVQSSKSSRQSSPGKRCQPSANSNGNTRPRRVCS